MIEAQQGLSYEDQIGIARRAELGGFETLFRSDHYAAFPGDSGQPTTDAWAILAGLAAWAVRDGASPDVAVGLCAAAVTASILSMASKDRIAALALPPAPEEALGWLLGGRDGRLLVVTITALVGVPIAGLITVTATAGVTLVLRLVLVRSRAGFER